AFANLVEDLEKFPVSTWLKNSLKQSIRKVILDSNQIRLASPPGQTKQFQDDGANLPWVLKTFKENYEPEFRDWIAHLQTALTDLKDILVYERPDDHHCYIKLTYSTKTEDIVVPSWLASDGTLRLLTLTLLAYLPETTGVFMIEEPENGIHPLAVETMYQSLANVIDAQILVASHSPVLLSMANPEQVLCFAKDRTGATDIISGDNHPHLVDWQRDTNLGELFAAGVLG
ncbi:MAG: ATP-binding protein, partial [Planctomycetaceae bacterium]|nr:ATP-binding protein [Planctomycetaceae bacterium]